MKYFFQGWAGLLLENGSEVSVTGYARVPVTFQALGGGNETRAETQPVFHASGTPLPVCARIGLFQSSSGLDAALISWPLERWATTASGLSCIVPREDLHLVLDRSASWQNGAQIGITAAGQPVYVAAGTTLVAGMST